MKLSKNSKKFRLDRARDLEILATLLKKVDFDNSNVYEARTQLSNEKKFFTNPNTKSTSPDSWGYDVNLTFSFQETPEHTHPDSACSMQLDFSIKLVGDCQDYDKKEFVTQKDPFHHLEFNLVIRGIGEGGKELLASYHLDRHIHTEENNEPDASHPIYHFQFGGRKLDKNNMDYGQSLILDAPRIAHYPMDLVLGIDFVLSNFFPATWRRLLQENDYVSLIREYQNAILKPYIYSLASKWKDYNNSDIDWGFGSILPNLL